MEEMTNPESEVMSEDQIIDGIADLLEPKEEADEDNAAVEGEDAKEEDEEVTDEEKEEETEEEEEQTFEIIHNGEKKALKQAELIELAQKGFDYTTKSQENAIERKAVEQAKQQVFQMMQASEQNAKDYAQVIALTSQIKQYEQIDWDTWSDNDPTEAQKAHRKYTELEKSRNALANKVSRQREQLNYEQQQHHAKLLEEGQAKLQEKLKDWNPQKQKEVIDYALSLGAREDTLAELIDPAIVIALHKAKLYDSLQSKKTQANKRVQDLPKVIKPGAAQPVSKKQASQDKLKRFKRTGSQDDAIDYLVDIL